jgi:phage regulator Rha-like protein
MSIVEIYNDEPRASSKFIAEGFGVEHRSVITLIKKYSDDFQEFGKLPTKIGFDDISNEIKSQSKGVRKRQEIYFLNEDQATFLGTLIRNSETSVKFKKLLVKDYSRCKKELAVIGHRQTDSEWLETRIQGKEDRLSATDAIKTFIDYAREQGSKNPDKYYMALTKMENAELFLVAGKFKNLRDVMSRKQLFTIAVADGIVEKSIYEGIAKKLYYKDIFQLAKARTQQFAALYGKSEVIDLMISHDNDNVKLIV